MKYEIQNIPQLRFPGFEGEWEETLLNDVAEFRKGKGISKSDIIEDGNLECIRYGELYTTYNELIVNIVSKTNLPLKGLELSEYNDVIIPASGETQLDIATASCVLKSGVALSGDLNIIRSSLNGIFLSFYLNNKKKLEIAKLAQGSSVVHLYSSQLKTLKLNIPTLPEQQKIASFLSSVDEKIQQLFRKKELLEQYKKGVMQQLFSGKLRFKDENGKDYADWEEKKLGEVCTNISYGMNAAATTYDGQNKYLRITDIDESSDGLNLDKLTSPNGLLEDKFRVKEGDLLFARTGASVGKTYLYRNSDGILYFAGFLIRFRVKGAIPAFVYLQTQTSKYNKWIKVMSMRSGQPGINAEEYKIFEISFPCLEEQQKIANFLSSIDAKIESTSQQINQTQSFKKGLLQQLFV